MGDSEDDDASTESLWGDAAALASSIGVSLTQPCASFLSSLFVASFFFSVDYFALMSEWASTSHVFLSAPSFILSMHVGPVFLSVTACKHERINLKSSTLLDSSSAETQMKMIVVDTIARVQAFRTIETPCCKRF